MITAANPQTDLKLCKTSIDSAFATYLCSVARREGMGFYVKTLKFVLLYREYFMARTISTKSTSSKIYGFSKKLPKIEVATRAIPDVCNEFVLEYCRTRNHYPWMPNGSELIELTEQMCSWLRTNGLTDRKLESAR